MGAGAGVSSLEEGRRGQLYLLPVNPGRFWVRRAVVSTSFCHRRFVGRWRRRKREKTRSILPRRARPFPPQLNSTLTQSTPSQYGTFSYSLAGRDSAEDGQARPLREGLACVATRSPTSSPLGLTERRGMDLPLCGHHECRTPLHSSLLCAYRSSALPARVGSSRPSSCLAVPFLPPPC